MTKSRKILCTLLALWMSAAVVPGQTLAYDTVPADFVEVEPTDAPADDMLPEALADVAPDAVAPSDTIAAADGVIASGTCGDNLTWVVDEEWTLTISGEGEMMDYAAHCAPWNKYAYSPYPDSLLIQKIVVENGVTSIGSNAFTSCISLSSVNLPDTLFSIGDHAFANCDTLTDIALPSSLTSIGSFAFEFCASVSSIIIPEIVTEIGDNVFAGCKELTAINVSPDNIQFSDIDGILYQNQNGVCTQLLCCPSGTNLEEVVLPNTISAISEGAFRECSRLKSITMSSTVSKIESCTFMDCTALESIQLDDTILRIDTWAFSGCSQLKDIRLPDSLEIGRAHV